MFFSLKKEKLFIGGDFIENLHLGRLLRKDIMTMANDKFSFDTAVSKIKSYL